MSASGLLAGANAARRIVLIAPAERPRLQALRDLGFTGYLIKPVRAASLAAVLGDNAPAIVPEQFESGGRDAAPVRSLAVLVAEDNEINALLTRALLTRLGHRPAGVTGGEAAVDAWRKAQSKGEPYDIILMDLHMPGIDGLEATRRIRELEQGRRTPIVALTANALTEGREQALAAGMDDFLVKPLDREHLERVLDLIAGSAAPVAA
jgi:CheY-like chemotaxis protein